MDAVEWWFCKVLLQALILLVWHCLRPKGGCLRTCRRKVKVKVFFKLKLVNRTGNFIPNTCCTQFQFPQALPTLVQGRNPAGCLDGCFGNVDVNRLQTSAQNILYSFECRNWTPFPRLKQTATLRQHEKESVTPTRVKASNGFLQMKHWATKPLVSAHLFRLLSLASNPIFQNNFTRRKP